MWLYLGIITTMWVVARFNRCPSLTDCVVAAQHTYTVAKDVYDIINKNGIGVCLMWTQQVIANQIGNRLVEMHHRYYIVHYPYGVSWYKIIIPRRRGPCRIDTILDEDGNNVKKDVCSFMGPSHNFHGTQVTPEMLGYNSLTFTDLAGDVKTFDKNDIITV